MIDRIDIDSGIFRAYDIRGIVTRNFTPAVLREIGKALGSFAQEAGTNQVVVARDGRLSGPELLAALNDGILNTGCDVVDIGLAPTPVLYFSIKYLGLSTGFVLTGSHNPPDYNGLKIVLNDKTWYGEDIQNIYHSTQKQAYKQGIGTYQTRKIIKDYINFIQQTISVPLFKSRPIKLVVDCGNGVTGVLAKDLYEALGAEVTALYAEVDGTFPNHHPDPGQPKNLEDLRRKVLELKADLGLAFDGDGDRLGIVDDQGKMIYPDRALMLFAREILKENPQETVLFDVKSSPYLFPEISTYGGKPQICATGHSLIKAKMKETGAILAGEFSGHFFFKENHGFDDGLYAGAKLLQILAGQDLSASALFQTIPEGAATPEIVIEIPESEKFKIIQNLQKNANFPGARISTIDGLRVDFDAGFGLIRASNTTASLVLRFEGKTQAALIEIQKQFKAYLLQLGYEEIGNFLR
ncbi:MAG: phosphomannomutase/phosphoglucomutase [Gammaproteobacteria bacterium]